MKNNFIIIQLCTCRLNILITTQTVFSFRILPFPFKILTYENSLQNMKLFSTIFLQLFQTLVRDSPTFFTTFLIFLSLSLSIFGKGGVQSICDRQALSSLLHHCNLPGSPVKGLWKYRHLKNGQYFRKWSRIYFIKDILELGIWELYLQLYKGIIQKKNHSSMHVCACMCMHACVCKLNPGILGACVLQTSWISKDWVMSFNTYGMISASKISEIIKSNEISS